MAAKNLSDRGKVAHDYFLGLQDRITQGLEAIDGAARFTEDAWAREEGGGGRSRVLAEGAAIEKGGVNVSCVFGELSEEFANSIPGEGRSFMATGLSLVIHPRSAHAPTVHANFRYLEKGEGDATTAWFGGGADLTPWVLYAEDAVHFHGVWKAACDRHSIVDHARLKEWCDRYFFLPHRGETRGIGGVFFDYLGAERDGPRTDLNQAEKFVRDAGDAFLDAYAPILTRRKDIPSTDDERRWQLQRRGRYVEFNLLYDRGTVFGLKTNGRVESILMSLPSLVRWDYGASAQSGTYQEALLEVLRSPRDWLGQR